MFSQSEMTQIFLNKFFKLQLLCIKSLKFSFLVVFFFQFWLFFFLLFSSGFPKIPNLSNSLNIQKVTVVRKINAMNKKSYCMHFMHKGSNHVIISFFLNTIKCFFETNVF